MKKKRSLKGFTLVELIIVMALFSLVMFSVAQLLSPVSKFYVRTSNYESTTACIDNMKRAIEGNLKYADRVRAYENYDPSVSLDGHVLSFWQQFFEDRQVIDCEGTIYAMAFDNSLTVAPSFESSTGNWVLPATYTNLNDIAENNLNSGMITLYQYTFDNTNAPTCVQVNNWYVNQRMYGNYDYQFRIGRAEDDMSSFSPDDFKITISAYEISRDHTGNTNRLVINPTAHISEASFSMKNVLDLSQHYAAALDDHKIVFDDASALYSVTGAKRYRMDPTGIPRYRQLERVDCDRDNIGTIQYGGIDLSHQHAGCPGFYFIYTLPDSVHDVSDPEYLSAVSNAYTTT